MFELQQLKAVVRFVLNALFAHRALYAALAICHASGCLVTEKPQLYGPMAVLYGILSLRG